MTGAGAGAGRVAHANGGAITNIHVTTHRLALSRSLMSSRYCERRAGTAGYLRRGVEPSTGLLWANVLWGPGHSSGGITSTREQSGRDQLVRSAARSVVCCRSSPGARLRAFAGD